ncbi:MAG: T9SS type A sorting domain-containing protein [Bacteroidia bacterium]|nr:T9SS type A sorting domain-containing protein [Bacteroidia bacterium]
MKRLLLYILTFFSISIYAQNVQEQLIEIVEAESKAAASFFNAQNRINANTGNYDLTYHKLEFTLDPNVAFISGVVTSTFTAKEPMSEITFDLDDNMTVFQVIQNGNSLSFSQNANDELVIILAQSLVTGQSGTVEITYSGNPEGSGFGASEQTTHGTYNDPIIWTLSEPYGAKAWWPCKQDLNDKIDEIDVYITTPILNPNNNEYIAVSNGVEQSQTINGLNKTTHFKHQYPIPAYLIAIAVTNYAIYSHTVPNNGNPFEIVNYVFPQSLSTAQISTPVTVDIMNLFTNLFEEYPFASEKYGHAQFGWGGGMEHTTVSFMGSFSRSLIAHELAHQWFGNKITCGSWKDIWLNEGFATYLSDLVVEHLDGNASFTAWKQSRINSITSQPDGAVYLTDQDTTSVSRIFNGRLSYNKGAMVLHMLRKKLGDTQFYQGLQDYLSDPDHAFAYAKTEEFIPIMENASGEDLTEFFNDWIYNQGYPSYTVAWNQDDPSQIRIEISQTQSHASVDYFESPVPLRIHGTGGETMDVVLDNTFNNQVFFRPISFTIDSVEFDPDRDLISKNNTVVLSLNEQSLVNILKLYPNPAQDILYIEKADALEIQIIEVYNILGQLEGSLNFSNTINIEHLTSGLHFIRFKTNEGIFHKTMLKQ